jgi:hypothetical protein
VGGLQPGFAGDSQLRQRLRRRGAEGAAVHQVRQVGDVAAVGLAPENVDVIVLSGMAWLARRPPAS